MAISLLLRPLLTQIGVADPGVPQEEGALWSDIFAHVIHRTRITCILRTRCLKVGSGRP